jgi:hypothetical protein
MISSCNSVLWAMSFCVMGCYSVMGCHSVLWAMSFCVMGFRCCVFVCSVVCVRSFYVNTATGHKPNAVGK